MKLECWMDGSPRTTSGFLNMILRAWSLSFSELRPRSLASETILEMLSLEAAVSSSQNSSTLISDVLLYLQWSPFLMLASVKSIEKYRPFSWKPLTPMLSKKEALFWLTRLSPSKQLISSLICEALVSSLGSFGVYIGCYL